MEPRELFGEARLVIILGSDRRLLNWVAYAFASATDRHFLWVDVRSMGEVRADPDPLSRNLVPEHQFAAVRAVDLAPSDARANVAISGVVRDDETPENLQRLMDFLRLPERTQAALSTVVVGGGPSVVVLSNAHRLGAFYPVEIVPPLLRAIKESGATVIMTFADAPNEGRFAFDMVLHLEGSDPAAWRQAVLRVEKGSASGPFPTGSTCRLADVEVVRAALSSQLG
jgi:hypothetical protein